MHDLKSLYRVVQDERSYDCLVINPLAVPNLPTPQDKVEFLVEVLRYWTRREYGLKILAELKPRNENPPPNLFIEDDWYFMCGCTCGCTEGVDALICAIFGDLETFCKLPFVQKKESLGYWKFEMMQIIAFARGE